MSKEEQIDYITDLLVDFDEMGFAPTTTVPDPDAYAIKWRNKLTKALEDFYKQSEWISVEERLPDREGTYLVYTYKGAIKFGDFRCYYAKNDNPQFDYYVTHWMPLPEAPKMKGGAE